VSALEDCVTSKLPDVLVKANRVIEEAEDCRRYAEP
jgi:hypothetical protein